jgi:hypothetical protein
MESREKALLSTAPSSSSRQKKLDHAGALSVKKPLAHEKRAKEGFAETVDKSM